MELRKAVQWAYITKVVQSSIESTLIITGENMSLTIITTNSILMLRLAIFRSECKNKTKCTYQ